jgi:hypothetical protein
MKSVFYRQVNKVKNLPVKFDSFVLSEVLLTVCMYNAITILLVTEQVSNLYRLVSQTLINERKTFI